MGTVTPDGGEKKCFLFFLCVIFRSEVGEKGVQLSLAGVADRDRDCDGGDYGDDDDDCDDDCDDYGDFDDDYDDDLDDDCDDFDDDDYDDIDNDDDDLV